MDSLVKSLYGEGVLQKTRTNFFAACAKMDVAICGNVASQDGQETVSAAVLERALVFLEVALLYCDLNLLGTSHDFKVFKSRSPTEIISAGRTGSTIQYIFRLNLAAKTPKEFKPPMTPFSSTFNSQHSIGQ